MSERVGAITGKQAMSVLTYLQGKGKVRDVALWAIGIGTGLRISDILDLMLERRCFCGRRDLSDGYDSGKQDEATANLPLDPVGSGHPF